jgi:hypothetical protein
MGEESPFGSKSSLQLEPKPREAIENLISPSSRRSSGLRTGSRTSRRRSSARAASGGSLPTTTGGSGKLRTVEGSDLYFLVCAAYDKKTKHFIGNMLWVFQPDLRPIGEKPWEEVPLDGIKLARLAFRRLPEKWDHSGPHFCEDYIGEVWKNLQQLGL